MVAPHSAHHTSTGSREPGHYIAAAVWVLAAAGGPLTPREIADEAVARSPIRPDGAAPEAATSSV